MLLLTVDFMDVHVSECTEVCDCVCVCVRERVCVCLGESCLLCFIVFCFVFFWQRNQNWQRDTKGFAGVFTDNPFSHFRKETLEKRYIKWYLT